MKRCSTLYTKGETALAVPHPKAIKRRAKQWPQADYEKRQRTGLGNICKGSELPIRWPSGGSEIDCKVLPIQDSGATRKIDDGKTTGLKQHRAGGEGSTSTGNHIRWQRRRRFDFEGGPVLATVIGETQHAAARSIGHEGEIEPHY